MSRFHHAWQDGGSENHRKLLKKKKTNGGGNRTRSDDPLLAKQVLLDPPAGGVSVEIHMVNDVAPRLLSASQLEGLHGRRPGRAIQKRGEVARRAASHRALIRASRPPWGAQTPIRLSTLPA